MIEPHIIIEAVCRICQVTPHEHCFGMYGNKFIFSRFIAYHCLSKYGGLSRMKIAEIYDVTYDTVSKRLTRVLEIPRKKHRSPTDEIFMMWYNEVDATMKLIDDIDKSHYNIDKSQCFEELYI